MDTNQEIATLGGGCFWCLEAVFEQLRGVSKVESGYSGGRGANPTYHHVCTGATGHAEAIQITFDPSTVSYAELLEVFWRTHDPTTLNRQGADEGTQYRSLILVSRDRQASIARAYVEQLDAAKIYRRHIVTEILPLREFYPAERAFLEHEQLFGKTRADKHAAGGD